MRAGPDAPETAGRMGRRREAARRRPRRRHPRLAHRVARTLQERAVAAVRAAAAPRLPGAAARRPRRRTAPAPTPASTRRTSSPTPTAWCCPAPADAAREAVLGPVRRPPRPRTVLAANLTVVTGMGGSPAHPGRRRRPRGRPRRHRTAPLPRRPGLRRGPGGGARRPHRAALTVICAFAPSSSW